MRAIITINREFPFQVPLTFEEAAMEVLSWLEDAPFEWDMYVDQTAKTVRYCFRTLEYATEFKRRFERPNAKAS